MLKKISVVTDFCDIINSTPSCKWLRHHDYKLKVFWCLKLKEVHLLAIFSPTAFWPSSCLSPWLLSRLKTPSIFSTKMIMYRSHFFKLGSVCSVHCPFALCLGSWVTKNLALQTSLALKLPWLANIVRLPENLNLVTCDCQQSYIFVSRDDLMLWWRANAETITFAISSWCLVSSN